MNLKNLKAELLSSEEIVRIFCVYNACDQLFEGSHILNLFKHIMALNVMLENQDAMIKAVLEESP